MPVPRHIAMIMDGNGRWAKARGQARIFGHRAGAETLDRVLGYCRKAGVQYLTVYAFSTENWRRPEDEVSGLMKLLSSYIGSQAKKLKKNDVRFRVIGRRADLSEQLQKEIAELEEFTKDCSQQLIVALSYGGRAEIVDAVNRLLEQRKGSSEPVTEEEFSSNLYAPDVPDPDLIIRTSGEFRVSNFLLWECAYSEFYITPVLWPDFGEKEFNDALASFGSRERRMGGHK